MKKKVKHNELAFKCENIFNDPNKIKLNYDPDDLNMPYTPIIQSGGKYNLKISAESNDEYTCWYYYCTLWC